MAASHPAAMLMMVFERIRDELLPGDWSRRWKGFDPSTASYFTALWLQWLRSF